MAEEEAEDLSAPVEEEEELAEDSMDDDQRGLPGLGKRRSTDTTSSVQTASKRPRPGSLAEVCLYPCCCTWVSCAVALHTCFLSYLLSGDAEAFACYRLYLSFNLPGSVYLPELCLLWLHMWGLHLAVHPGDEQYTHTQSGLPGSSSAAAA